MLFLVQNLLGHANRYSWGTD